MTTISVLIPHKRDPENDKALDIALAMYAANTVGHIELMVDDTTPADPYVLLNDMARRTEGEYLFFGNSDLFPGPGWDTALLECAAPDTMTTATLVEPGAIGVHIMNIHRNFGMTPDQFDRAAFEGFAASTPELPAGDGFFYYLLMRRADFLDFGAFDLTRGLFPEPLDIYFWERWLTAGKRIVRSAALFYHLQNFSNPAEQQKAVRLG
jgi:hypothetical protein